VWNPHFFCVVRTFECVTAYLEYYLHSVPALQKNMYEEFNFEYRYNMLNCGGVYLSCVSSACACVRVLLHIFLRVLPFVCSSRFFF